MSGDTPGVAKEDDAPRPTPVGRASARGHKRDARRWRAWEQEQFGGRGLTVVNFDGERRVHGDGAERERERGGRQLGL